MSTSGRTNEEQEETIARQILQARNQALNYNTVLVIIIIAILSAIRKSHPQSYPQPSQENEAKILWDIPWKLEKCPMNGANRPDISVLDKKNKEWTTITMRTKHKKDKYIDLKLGIKNLYPGHKVKLITVVFDFLAVYYKDLEELTSILY